MQREMQIFIYPSQSLPLLSYISPEVWEEKMLVTYLVTRAMTVGPRSLLPAWPYYVWSLWLEMETTMMETVDARIQNATINNNITIP